MPVLPATVLPATLLPSTLAGPEPGPDDTPLPSPPVFDQSTAIDGRYVDLRLIGRGGMGEVRLVHDLRLGRPAVLKTVRPEIAGSPLARRLQVEAEITARLQHPGVVPVYDAGTLPDGRPYYVMREVRGVGLDELIAAVHEASPGTSWGMVGGAHPCSGWGFRQLVEALRRACDTVAYAHERRILHRDLKPANIAAEGFGAVLVLDWGLAELLDAPPPSAGETRVPRALGTPGYMPPEQAEDRRADLGPPSDVFALGAILHEVLYGRLGAVAAPLPRVPEALAEAAEIACQPDPQARFPSARELAAALAAWLDGADRRDRALKRVEEADATLARIHVLRAEATTRRAHAEAILGGLPARAPIDQKRPGWIEEDTAIELEDRVVSLEQDWTRALDAALQLDPELPEAHSRLADHHRAAYALAEARRDRAAATRAEAQLRAHDRGQHAAWLAGDGTLNLDTSPQGARVTLRRYVLRDRRLVPDGEQVLGTTPLQGVRVPRGSLRCRLEFPGRPAVELPIFVGRGEAWSNTDPDSRVVPIPLPERDDPELCFVPPGWFLAGGDTQATDPLPAARWWLDGFSMQRHPVTNGAWLRFLNALLDEGRLDEARAHAPRPLDGGDPEARPPRFPLDNAHFSLPDDEDPDVPITGIRWTDARAYAEWLARHDGRPWRLPHELEWEKAARGPDGRLLPWGDFFEPTWACNIDSQAGAPRAARVSAWPEDVSPYGVRGLAGNVRDWCANAWRRGGPEGRDGRLLDPLRLPMERIPEHVAVRGGSFSSARTLCRPATRFGAPPTWRYAVIGLRLVCDTS